jgi:DNA-binding NtrC family response regulator
MKANKNRCILIVDPDAHFREGLYNFLLSAGYEKVASAENLRAVLEKIKDSAYDTVVLDAGPPLVDDLTVVRGIVELNPSMKIILMIRDEDQHGWNEKGGKAREFQFLIKSTFARNLLYLLESKL